jgi:hypothetical protein
VTCVMEQPHVIDVKDRGVAETQQFRDG